MQHIASKIGIPKSKYLGNHKANDGLGKVPPQVQELERVVLGAVMLEKSALNSVVEFLRSEHFYNEINATIYEAIVTLFEKSQPIDIKTVRDQLRRSGKLTLIGDATYLVELTNEVSQTGSVAYYGRVIVEMAIKRTLISVCNKAQGDAYDDTVDVFTLLDKTEQAFFKIYDSNLSKNFSGMSSLVYKAIQDLQKAKTATNGTTGVPSGLLTLDRLTAGWQKSDLVIVAARPGVGKTAFVLTVLRNAAVDYKIPVAIFSLEMASIQLVHRMLSSEAEVDGEKLKKGTLNHQEWNAVAHKSNILSSSPIFIDDSPALSILELRAKARRLKAEHNVQLIVVDYLQLMRGEDTSNREQEISSISRALKGLAKELDIPVIALSQLSRSVETRGGDKRPQLSDLRESGSIEQDADMVLFLYRPEYYKIMVDEDNNPTDNVAEVIIAKHRNGPTGTAKLKFIGQYTKFANFSMVSDDELISYS